MSVPENQGLRGTLLDDSATLTLEDLSRLCSVDQRHIVALVEEGVLSAVTISATQWHFNGSALRRARLAVRLERDLEVNLAGVALALDLLEEIDRLRRALGSRYSEPT
jgi:chaperone modulatory protein CbpM